MGGYRALNTLKVFRTRAAWPFQLSENRELIEGRRLYGEGVCPVAEAFLTEGNLELKIHPPCGAQEMRDTVTAMQKVLAQAGSLR